MSKEAYIGVLIVSLLVGCASEVSVPTETVEPIVTSAPSTLYPTQITQEGPALSHTPSSTLFPNPEAPLPIPDTVPVADLNPEGPWLVFDSAPVEHYGYYQPQKQLWGMNATDASGAGMLDTDMLLSDFKQNPYDKKLFVYVAQETLESSPVLKMLRVPEGTTTTIAPIVTEDAFDVEIDEEYETPRSLLFASYSYNNPTWSPDGTKVAFTGVLDDQSLDVYVYDFITNEVRRIADLVHYETLVGASSDWTPFYPYNLKWSPDGQYVLFKDFPGIMMPGYPDASQGSLWAAHLDGQHQVQAVECDPAFGAPEYFGWWGPGHAIVAAQCRGEGCPIVTVDLETGLLSKIDQIYRGWGEVAYSYEHNAWLITNANVSGDDPYEGTLLVVDGVVTDIQNDDLSNAEWLEDEGVFLAYDYEDPDTKYLITLDGEITVRPPQENSIVYPEWEEEGRYIDYIEAPDDSLLLWVEGSGMRRMITGLWVGEPGETPQRIYQLSEELTFRVGEDLVASHVRWSTDSQYLIIFTTRGIFFAHRPNFNLIQMTGYPIIETSHSVWVNPEE